jgi:general secretion pathway protein C
MKPPGALADRVRRLVAPAAPGGARHAGSGPQLALVVAAALIAGQLALLVWHLLPGALRRTPPALGATSAGARFEVNDILQAHPFGTAPLAPGAAGEVQATRVPLILAGTLAVKDPAQGLAIVGETAQSGKLYAVGAMLPGGVRLHEVYTDHIVVERDGVLELLALPRKFNGAGTLAGPVLSAPGNTTEPAMAESVQRLIAQGPEVIGEVLRPMPTYVEGKLKGFRVYPGRDRGKFGMLGLHAGDLVTQINGVPLSDPQRGMEILRTLGTQGAAQVTVERGAVTQQLSIDAAQIATLGQSGNAPAPPAELPQPPQPPNSD